MKIHLDLDSFFVSAHRVYDKTHLNRPVVVAKSHDREIFESFQHETVHLNRGALVGDLIVSKKGFDSGCFFENGKIRGIVLSASYEARKYGVKTGMTLKEALLICPSLKVLAPRYKLYHNLSFRLKKFLQLKIPLVEQYSIDEFFGDLGGWVEEEGIYGFCVDLKKEIYERFSLPVSIGISNAKWIAKLATSAAKPDGVLMVDDIENFTENMDVSKFPGIGRRMEKKLKSRGILTLGDIRRNREFFYSLGKNGEKLYKRVCGIDAEGIVEKKRKSIGISRRFDAVYDRRELLRRVGVLCRYLSFLVLKHALNPTFYYLKIKYKDKSSSKAHMRVERFFNEFLLRDVMKKLFIKADEKDMGVISLSLVLGRFKKKSNLFDYEEDLKFQKLNEAIFKIRSRYGISSLV